MMGEIKEDLIELVTAFEMCRERNPDIWIGFVSSRLENALNKAKKHTTIDHFVKHWPQACWFDLPKALKDRWWSETDYSRLEPSEELIIAINKELGAR